MNQTINCHWCDQMCVTTDENVEKQLSKYGGWFCKETCKTEYVYAEFEYIMQQPVK